MDNPAAVQTGEPANVLKYSTPYVTSVDQLIKVKRIWEMKSKIRTMIPRQIATISSSSFLPVDSKADAIW